MIALALLLAHAAPTEPPQHDGLRYAMGGTMSGYASLSIDFVTGDYSFEERPAIVGERATPRRTGRLPNAAVAGLRTLARASVRAGFETRECIRRYSRPRAMPMMPNIDATPRMAVTLGGRLTTAPIDIGCWSAAASRLASAAYDAARAG